MITIEYKWLLMAKNTVKMNATHLLAFARILQYPPNPTRDRCSRQPTGRLSIRQSGSAHPGNRGGPFKAPASFSVYHF